VRERQREREWAKESFSKQCLCLLGNLSNFGWARL